MTWPVNYIEQAVYYNRLLATLAQLNAQTQTVSVSSFREPTQQQWEDAYVRQVEQIVPIQPGTRLFWMDMKNGTPKRYATVYSPDGITIDPLVRPFVDQTQERGCFRFLGKRQLLENSQVNSVNSPIRHKEFGLVLGLNTMIQKNLLALVIQFRMISPPWISLFGDARGSVASDAFWGASANGYYVTLERAAGASASSGFVNTNTDGYTPQTGNSPTIVATEQHTGYTLVFAPAGPLVSDEYQPFSSGMMYVGLTAAQTAQATPMHFWQSGGAKVDATGLKELYFGTPNAFGLVSDAVFIYGIFASDPGPIEVFNV